MDKNRKTAFLVLKEIETMEAYSNLTLNRYIGEEKPDSPAFVRELVYGVLERKLYLDYVLSRFLSNPKARMKAADRTLLRMGIYQIMYMNSVPGYAAVDGCVRLAKVFCKGRDGFINGVLRGFLKHEGEIPLPDEGDLLTYLSVKYSYDKGIVSLWLSCYGRERTEEFLGAGNRRSELTIRTNTLKMTPEELTEKLEAEGFTVKKGRYVREALLVSGSYLLSGDLYKSGCFSVQDESSMLAVEALSPKPGEVVVDVCAAPGGKSLFCAERMKNKGTIYSRDVYDTKLELLSAEAARLSVSIVETKVFDGELVDEALLEKADRVLVDAPCSGLGVIRRKPEIKYKKIDRNERELPQKQLCILQAASRYVKKGGTLVYSTCTVNPAENEEVVKEFLEGAHGFTSEDERQIFPCEEGPDGFFISRMKRNQ